MQRTAAAQLRASAVSMDDGTTAFPPQVGAGYGAFWLRDYAYMLEGCSEAFTDQEVIDAYQTFIGGMTAEGVCVDCIKFDGTPIYKPGFGTMGVNPVADGSQFTVDVAYHTFRKTGNLNVIASTIDRLEDAMRAVPTNPATGLVHIVPGSPQERCPYGFTDTIPKQGEVRFDIFRRACIGKGPAAGTATRMEPIRALPPAGSSTPWTKSIPSWPTGRSWI